MTPTAPLRSVLLIGNFLSASGKSRGVCEDLSEHLEESGWNVCSASTKPSRVFRLLDMLSTIWSKRGSYRGAQVEVYSGPAFLWAEASCWLLTLMGRPYVLALHGGALPQFAKRYPARVRRLLKSASAVTAPSHYLAHSLSSFRSDIEIVPNALDLDRYRFQVRTTAQPKLIWLRAFHSMYNPVMAVQVLHRILPRYPQATLTMVGGDKGDGSLGQVRYEAERLGITARVRIEGPCAKADVPAHLAEGDIFLNTTNFDNTPVSVLEAMACGLCVVTTDVGGIPYLLESERDALLVRAEDADAMAAAVERILQDGTLARSLSLAGRKKTEAMAWREVLPRWERLLADLRAR